MKCRQPSHSLCRPKLRNTAESKTKKLSNGMGSQYCLGKTVMISSGDNREDLKQKAEKRRDQKRARLQNDTSSCFELIQLSY